MTLFGQVAEIWHSRRDELEGQADDLHDAGLKGLFGSHGYIRTMAFIVGSEIYGHLEKIVDRFEDVANEIQGIVIDHA